MKYAKEEVIQYTQEEDVKFIRLAFCDVFGKQKNISIIGVDFAGVRRGKEHTPKYQYCADRGVFIIENLCNLKEILNAGGQFIAQSYPMNYEETTGLPCRVVAEL